MNETKRKNTCAPQAGTAGAEGANAADSAVSEDRAVPDGEELVSYTAPMIYGGADRDILAAVNGEVIRVKRGETVMIKRKFLEVLDNAATQEAETLRFIREAQEKAKKPLMEL